MIAWRFSPDPLLIRRAAQLRDIESGVRVCGIAWPRQASQTPGLRVRIPQEL